MDKLPTVMLPLHHFQNKTAYEGVKKNGCTSNSSKYHCKDEKLAS